MSNPRGNNGRTHPRRERDLTDLYDGRSCVICHEASQDPLVPWLAGHATRHLADGSATVLLEEAQAGAPKRERIVPANSFPEEPDPKRKAGRPRTVPSGIPAGFEVRDGMLKKKRSA